MPIGFSQHMEMMEDRAFRILGSGGGGAGGAGGNQPSGGVGGAGVGMHSNI